MSRRRKRRSAVRSRAHGLNRRSLRSTEDAGPGDCRDWKETTRNGHTRRIYYGIPDSRLRLIAGNHFIASEKSFEFNRAVAAFLHATEGSKVKTMKRLWADRHPGRLDQEMGFDSAVLVPLLEKDGEYHLLFEVQSGGPEVPAG